MDSLLSKSPRRNSSNFQKIVDSFLQQPGLAFNKTLTADLIEQVFAKHEGLFGIDAIYCTTTVLWAFLGQVLSCKKAWGQAQSIPGRKTGDRHSLERPKLD